MKRISGDVTRKGWKIRRPVISTTTVTSYHIRFERSERRKWMHPVVIHWWNKESLICTPRTATTDYARVSHDAGAQRRRKVLFGTVRNRRGTDRQRARVEGGNFNLTSGRRVETGVAFMATTTRIGCRMTRRQYPQVRLSAPKRGRSHLNLVARLVYVSPRARDTISLQATPVRPLPDISQAGDRSEHTHGLLRWLSRCVIVDGVTLDSSGTRTRAGMAPGAPYPVGLGAEQRVGSRWLAKTVGPADFEYCGEGVSGDGRLFLAVQLNDRACRACRAQMVWLHAAESHGSPRC